jgi:nucleotide-binding universal stress UspA family protein
MDNINPTSYHSALEDFHSARRKAALEGVVYRLTGKPYDLLQYDEVRKRLGGIESARKELREIPLDAIVGTAGRPLDFSRQLMPLRESDSQRWAKVMVAVKKMEGLDPIEVYQVGDAYFIVDGHHRASVARELGATHIQAYVREVQTRVPLEPTDTVEDVILKAGYADFLKNSHLDEIRPDANLRVTVPWVYEKLLEHIAVHRYFLGVNEKREIPEDEAVSRWYDEVYLPVVKVIRQRNLFENFPGLTETDLYIEVMEHRYYLERDLGWKVPTGTAANDYSERYSPSIPKTLNRFLRRMVDVITPEEFVPGSPPGEWRRQRGNPLEYDNLFDRIMVAVPGDPSGWDSVEMAANLARKENAFVGGLHVVPGSKRIKAEEISGLEKKFTEICSRAGVEGNLIVEAGDVTRLIYGRSFWADLVVLRLLHPPPILSVRRLRSGLRTLIRICPPPLLALPPGASTSMNCALLAYGGGAKADEALYVATYMARRWGLRLTVVTVDRGRIGDRRLETKARHYLNQVKDVRYVFEKGEPSKIILKTSAKYDCDLILMGGYERNLAVEVVFGSTVDRVLWRSKCPVLICH